jgi:hypothetical protein
VQNDWSSPSGSRWEPVPQPGGLSPSNGVPSDGVPSDDVAGDPASTAAPRRRARRPVVAVLLAVLGVGAVTAGAACTQGDGAPAPGPASRASSQVSRGTGHGDHHHGPRGASS